MSYDSSNLTTPDIKWLGVRPSDLDRLNIPQQCRLPMTDEDMRTGRKLVRVEIRLLLSAPQLDSPTLHNILQQLGVYLTAQSVVTSTPGEVSALSVTTRR